MLQTVDLTVDRRLSPTFPKDPFSSIYLFKQES